MAPTMAAKGSSRWLSQPPLRRVVGTRPRPHQSEQPLARRLGKQRGRDTGDLLERDRRLHPRPGPVLVGVPVPRCRCAQGSVPAALG